MNKNLRLYNCGGPVLSCHEKLFKKKNLRNKIAILVIQTIDNELQDVFN